MGYLEDAANCSVNAFRFWRSKQIKYPYLAPVSQYFLSIYLTSAEAERLFSSGRIVTKSRANLSVDTIRKMVIINNNSIKNLHHTKTTNTKKTQVPDDTEL